MIDLTTSAWRHFPEGTRAASHVWAIGDVHGRADLLRVMLAHVNAQAERHEALEIVFLGDLIDRGPSGLECIAMAMAGIPAASRPIVLPGNHEGLMLQALTGPANPEHLDLWLGNGGEAVLDEAGIRPGAHLYAMDASALRDFQGRIRDAIPAAFIRHLQDCPSHYSCGDLLFVHAGIQPPLHGDPAEQRNALKAFLSQPLITTDPLHWSWIRQPFLDWSRAWDPEGRMIVVHGNSIEYRSPDFGIDAAVKAVDRCSDKRRINLDVGSFRFARIACLEAVGNRYRFHFAHARSRHHGPALSISPP